MRGVKESRWNVEDLLECPNILPETALPAGYVLLDRCGGIIHEWPDTYSPHWPGACDICNISLKEDN